MHSLTHSASRPYSAHHLLVVAVTAATWGCGSASSPPVATSTPESQPAHEAVPSDGALAVELESGLLPSMPEPVTSFGATKLGNDLYVFGGYHGRPHHYTREGQSRSLWRLSLDESGTWVRAAHLDAGLQGLALLTAGESVCRFGGTRIHNRSGEETDMESVDEAACFSPSAQHWNDLPPLPSPRSSHEGAVVNGIIYLAGGWRLGAEGPGEAEWAQDVLAFDPQQNRWQHIQAPFQRRAVGVASAGGKLVVLGGLTPEREVSRRVDVYDPSTQVWSQGPDFPADAFGAAAVGSGDAIYASARNGVVYRYRMGETDWTPVFSLAFPRFFHQLVVVDGALIALGGIGGMHTEGRNRHVERLPLASSTPRLASWSMAYPGRAKNRQAVFVHEGSVYLFGGNNSLGQHDFQPENFVDEGLRLHLETLQWKELPAYPARRQTMQTLIVEEPSESSDRPKAIGLSAGGFGHNGEAAVTQAEVYAFDFAQEVWSERGALPQSRTQFGLGQQGDKIWVFGGLNYDPARGDAAFDHVTDVLMAHRESHREVAEEDVYRFQPSETSLPGSRRAFAATVHDGHYYIVGGMREGFQLVDECLAFEFESGLFEAFPCPQRTRLSARLMTIGNRLVLAGGSYRGDAGMESDRSVEVFDLDTKEWSVLIDELSFETRHMHIQRFENRLLLLSTHNPDQRVRIALVDLYALPHTAAAGR